MSVVGIFVYVSSECFARFSHPLLPPSLLTSFFTVLTTASIGPWYLSKALSVPVWFWSRILMTSKGVTITKACRQKREEGDKDGK